MRWLARSRKKRPTARIANPPARLVRSGRLQRQWSRAAGVHWAALPHTAGFIDPLHSTGIAQTICGVERLADLLVAHWRQPALAGALKQYDRILQQEFAIADKLVTLCYLARFDFRLYTHAAMPYFAAAHTYEQRRKAGAIGPGAAFLNADDVDLVRAVNSIWRELKAIVSEAGDSRVSDARAAAFQQLVATQIAPYNSCGLCDVGSRNMYRHTIFTWA